MQIENVAKFQRIGGRMVMAKRRTFRKGVDGFTLKLEGNVEKFVPAGSDVEITAFVPTRTRSRR
jgi:hypothetical protein